MKNYFVTGIGTDVGKTIASAILCEAMKADYWKPVQAGDLKKSDRIKVNKLISNNISKCWEEAYALPYAMSPHASAEKAGIEIDLNLIQLPPTNNNLIIEGAGGLMVPVNRNTLYIDLIKKFNAEVILISRNYLGSINHTLLSAEALMVRNIPVKGIIFNGNENEATESVILNMTGFKLLGRIDEGKIVDKFFVLEQAERFRHLL
jgi:dethiobiotin synthetase